jgi:peroxin-5
MFTGPQYHSNVCVDKQLQNAFQSLEQGQTSVEPVSEPEPASQPQEADLLARTAGLLVESVEHERNPKFANSQFLGLMKQLRDRKAIVEGNDIVAAPPETGQTNTVSVDLKGKGRAVPSVPTAIQEPGAPQLLSFSSSVRPTERAVPIESEEDPNEAYFRQDNEDYANYWKAHHAPVPPVTAPPQEWQELQRAWERFEATATGVRPLAKYQFQPGNPYLLGERSHNHAMHGGSRQGLSSTEVCGLYFVLSKYLLN